MKKFGVFFPLFQQLDARFFSPEYFFLRPSFCQLVV
jgi:hypothetical protein